jgi:hypothetical protein
MHLDSAEVSLQAAAVEEALEALLLFVEQSLSESGNAAVGDE